MKTLPAIALTAALFLASTARADELSDLKSRFRDRDAQLTSLKHAGTLGETYQGFLEAPSGSAPGDAAKLLAAENADRKRLYVLIAQQQQSTPDVVATANAKRNFERAASGELLKYPDGWHKKP